MDLFLYYTLVSFLRNLPVDNPAVMDILKVFVGTTAWIGGLVAILYRRERKLKAAHVK